MFENTKRVGIVSVIVAAAFTISSFALVWLYAPEVGGAWWPYIRVALSFFVSIIVGKLSLIAAQIVILFTFGKEVFQNGTEENPWDEEAVDDFVENFDQ